jgi:hypothetical protein
VIASIIIVRIKPMLEEYIKENWQNHLAAGGGTLTSLINGASVLQSVIVGVLIYMVTHTISAGAKFVLKKLRP